MEVRSHTTITSKLHHFLHPRYLLFPSLKGSRSHLQISLNIRKLCKDEKYTIMKINVYWLNRFSLQSYSLFRPKAHQRLNSMWHETRVEDIKQKVNKMSSTLVSCHILFSRWWAFGRNRLYVCQLNQSKQYTFMYSSSSWALFFRKCGLYILTYYYDDVYEILYMYL